MMTEFANLEDKELHFYGVDGEMFKLDDTVWEALEDEDDGYRSYLDTIKAKTPDEGIFQDHAFAKVRVENVNDGYFNGWQLVDLIDSHVWLRVGTDNMDDYYPWFVFQYDVKK